MKFFETPAMEIVTFTVMDVVTTTDNSSYVPGAAKP